MNALLKLLGVLLILGGIAAGIYLDFWVLFIGGIMQFIEGVKANPTNGHDVLWGVLRALVFTGCGSFLTFLVLFLPGAALLGVGSKDAWR